MAQFRGRHTRRRRAIQLAFLGVFVLLPLFDLLRFDFPGNRLLFFRAEVGLDEWAILGLAILFAMWLVGAVSLLFGRVYCAYACPQMVFTELAHDLDALGKRLARRIDPKARPGTARAVSLAGIALLSLAATVLFMGYFAPLPEVLRRLARLDVGPWIGAVGAVTTALGIANLVFVRESFCRTACPYGLLQGVIEDGRSLNVRFDATPGACIECGACERVCPMEIDIRDGSFQIECTRCGSCIDACDEVLGRLKRPGLLAFDTGGLGHGGWDAKRLLVTAATVGFGVALAFVVARRETLALRLSPLYTESQAATDEAESRFLLRATNRGKAPVALEVEAEGLPAGARVEGVPSDPLAPGAEQRFTLVVRLPRQELHGSVTPFVWVVRSAERQQRFDAAFYAPARRSS
jgi:cytochrome c oxidase accessory protein FixG